MPLAQLRTHERELLARMGEQVRRKRAHPRQLLPVVARHLAAKRALHVHDLVMRDRQDEILRKGVHQRERDVLVVELAEPGVELQIVAHVVHPAHVPLEVEAEAAILGGPCDERPRGRLLGDHQRVRVDGKRSLVERAQEVDGL